MMIAKAIAFLKQKEGFTSKAIWDVNAWRIGYGSDTITDPSGIVRRVNQGDQITQADADRDLSRRIQFEFIPRIKGKIGADIWEKLPENTQVAFISFAYNYGNITKKSIVDTVKTLDLRKLAEVWITSTYNDNKTLPENVRNALRARRAQEAALISSDIIGSNKKIIIIPLILLLGGAYLISNA